MEETTKLQPMVTKEEPEPSKSKSTFMDRLKSIKEWKNWNRETKIYALIFLAIVVVTFYLYYRIVEDKTFLYGIVVNFAKKMIEISNDEQYGWLVFVLFLVFMAIQGLLMPIPSELVLLLAGLIWGVVLGSFMGYIGSIFAAVLCYWIAYKGGGPMVEHFLGEENVEILDVALKKTGAPAVFTLRAIPMMSFDIVSYISGLVEMKFWKYLVANLLGCVTRAIFWGFLGQEIINDPANGVNTPQDLLNPDIDLDAVIESGAGDFNVLIIILVIVTLAFMAIYQYVLIPKIKKKRDEDLAAMSKEEREQLLNRTTTGSMNAEGNTENTEIFD